MSMKKIGETLRQERIRQGLSVGDVNVKIKLSREMIEAMEEGRMEDLPQPVYVRGFVRSYAAMLGLDHTKLGADLSEISAEPDSAISSREALQQPSGTGVLIAGERKQNNLVAVLVLLMVLGAIAVMAWYAVSSNNPGPAAPDVHEQAVAEDAPQDVVEEPEPPVVEQAEDPVGEAVLQAGETVQEADAGDVAQAAEALQPGEGEIAAQEEAQPFQEGGPHQLVIDAVEECWLGLTIDGQETREVTLFAGDLQTFLFSERLEIRIGNPGGVRLQYDGAAFPFEYSAERPKNLVFPPSE